MSNKEKTLSNIENYNKTFDYDNIYEYINKYSILIKEYVHYCKEGIFIQNSQYLVFIIERGIETIFNIYSLLLLYTKNLDITFYHCQKAYYYYIEFIGQIGNDSNSFLQLNSKDATLFVYKKTICDINTDYRKKMELSEKENNFISIIKNSCIIYNKLLYSILDNQTITLENKDQILESSIYKIKEIFNKLDFSFDNIDEYNEKIKSILHFIDLLILKDEIDNIKLLSIVESFIKKIAKNMIEVNIINKKIYNTHFDIVLKTYNTTKIINWFFQ
tara:strand:+ start:752 stop:1573 length:822 start_codon:yes stop_codon:yes gene_type:complete